MSVGWKAEGIGWYAVKEGEPSNPSEPTVSTWDGVYVYSINSDVFHKSNCPTATNISDENKRTSKTRNDLINSGKRPCKVCNP